MDQRPILIALTQAMQVRTGSDLAATSQNPNGSKFMAPQAVVWVQRDEVWEITAIFQSVFRAVKFFGIGGYDKPTALVYREANGWEVEFHGAFSND